MRVFTAHKLTGRQVNDRPSFAAANQIMTLARVANKRVV